MLKKMMLLAMAVGALIAFAAPAAQGQVLHEVVEGEEVPLEEGAKVTLTSTNLVMKVTANGAEIKCAHATIHGTVLENATSGSTINGDPTSVTFKECNREITNPSFEKITIFANTTALMENTTLQSSPCHFSGNLPFSYVHGSDVLTVTGADQKTGNCGPAHVTGSYTLETSNGTPVYIS